MMEKKVEVVIAGSGEAKLLALTQYASVEDVIKEASLEGYALSRSSGSLLPKEENIYDLVENGERIYAVPGNLEVGFSTPFWGDIDERIKKIPDSNYSIPDNLNHILYPDLLNKILQKEKVRFLGTKKLEPSVKEKGKRQLAPYWQRKGWKEFGKSVFRSQEGYQGHYATKYGSWSGIIIKEFGNNYAYYIINPPATLIKGNHSACFKDKGNGKYGVHFQKEPKTINEGIITIEKTIAESFA
jgi:hypothetical protein